MYLYILYNIDSDYSERWDFRLLSGVLFITVTYGSMFMCNVCKHIILQSENTMP